MKITIKVTIAGGHVETAAQYVRTHVVPLIEALEELGIDVGYSEDVEP